MTPELLLWTCAAVFLPLFPLSAIFNAAFAAARWSWARIVLVVLWPQIGLWLLSATGAVLAPPRWLLPLAVATAVFYAWRMLSVRALPIWVGFWVTSAWALAWVAMISGVNGVDLRIAMAGVSLTAAALVCGVRAITDRWGEAYLGPWHGLGWQAPRLAGTLALALLAAMGAPVLPMFFVLLWLVMHSGGYAVAAVMAVWLLWSWSAARVWQALAFGVERREAVRSHQAISDLSGGSAIAAWLFALAGAATFALWSARWLIH